MSICLIFNPAARGEKAKKFQKSLEAVHGKFALKPTHCAGAARQLASYETMFLMGLLCGDGAVLG